MVLRPLLAASAVLLIAVPARAERPQDAVTLTYLPSRATVALCPAADFLALEVRIRLGYELFQPSAPNHLTVEVERANGLFRSTGEMRDDDGRVIFTRDFSEIDCTAAVISMAISVAIKFMRLPEEPARPGPSPPAPAALTCPPAPKPAAPDPPVPPALPLTERPRPQAGLASVFSIGAAPVVVGGISGFLGVRWKNISVALEARALFAPSATMDNYSIRDGYHYLVSSVAGSGCYHAGWAFSCARAELGALFVGNSKIPVTPPRTAFFAFGLVLGGEWALTKTLALRAYAELSARPLSGLLRENATNSILWPGSVVSSSVGLGPVVTLPAF